jgi:hypothetical protein
MAAQILPDARELYADEVAGRLSAKAQAAQGKSGDWGYEEPKEISLVPRILFNYIGSKILEKVPSAGSSVPSIAIDTMVNQAKNYMYNQAMAEFGNRFPALAHQVAWFEGSSTAEAYYTAHITGLGEIPLHIRGQGEREPSVENLVKCLEAVTKDPLTNSGMLNNKLRGLYNRKWSSFYHADNRYMNGDLKNVEQYEKFWEGFSKLDLYHIHGSGKRSKVHEFTDASGTKIEILRYDRPPRMLTYLYNLLGNWGYDFLDTLFYNPVKMLGPTAVQVFTEGEWRMYQGILKKFGGADSMQGGHFT